MVTTHALLDLKGKPMKIKKTGAVYPVDVDLSTTSFGSMLTVSVKVNFVEALMTERDCTHARKNAVFQGICG